MIKLINESSLFQHSFLIHYFNGNIFLLHIYIIPFGYCKSQAKSNYFRSNCDLILDLTTFQNKSPKVSAIGQAVFEPKRDALIFIY